MGAQQDDRARGDLGGDTAATRPAREGLAGTGATTAPAGARSVEVGDRIGRYALTSELGQGGMGRVFVAFDAGLERLAAIKFISVVSTEMVKRFLAEARATARCIHPNIVAVYEIGQHGGAPYLVLEHLDGPSLSQLMRGERLPLPRVITIMTAVARALACAHSHGIVHRDLKPSNIVVLPGDVAKVLDFGIAAFAHSGIAADDDHDATRSLTGEVAGTLPYMAPEQLRGAPADGRVDLWAFGIVLYQLLAGQRPFDDLSEAALRAELQDQRQPTPSIARHRPDLPPALVEIVARCLAKARAQRFQSAEELLAAMQRLAGEHAAQALPTWLATAPSAAESDRVALGLIRAVATHTAPIAIDLDATKVWPDGRVELGTRTETSSTADQVQVVARLAIRAIDGAGGLRTPLEARRARRMRRVLERALRATGARSASAGWLEQRLTEAYRARRHGVAALAVVAGLMVVAVAVWRWSPAPAGSAATTSAQVAQLERLEEQMARLRTAGDDPGADALFDSFTAQPENAPLRSEAWRRRSGRELADRQLESALASAGRSYLAAANPRAAARALAAVVEVQVARRRWDEVGRALVELGASDDVALARAGAAVAVATRRAVARDPMPSAPLATATALLVGTPAPVEMLRAEALDLDGDGQDELVTVADRVVRGLRPGGDVLWEQPFWEIAPGRAAGEVATCATRDATSSWLAVMTHRAGRLYRVDVRGATLVHETGGAASCALGDLDGDGAAELYLASGRDLVRHHLSAPGTWSATRQVLGSQANAVVAADLDGDGRHELAVAVGEWQAFDVRVLAGAELTLVDRVRLGRVVSLAALSRGPGRPALLLAHKTQGWPSLRFLPPVHPTGAPDGLYLLRLHADRLGFVGRLDDELRSEVAVRAADLDGDGRDEGLVNDRDGSSQRQRLLVLHVAEDHELEATTIEGVSVLAAGRFAGGPVDSALAAVTDGPRPSRWWLGLGTTPVPSIPASLPPRTVPVPPGLVADLATTWRRASTLASVGATASALAAFEHLAAVVPADHQAAALAAVLELRLRGGESLGTVYEALAARASPGSTDQLAALTGAMTAALDDGELAAAIRVIDAALSSPALGAEDRLRLQTTRARIAPVARTLFDGGALDGAWAVHDPVGVRRDPVTRALVLDGFGAAPLAGVELVRTGGPIALSIEATIERAEWGAGIAFALQPIGDEARPLHIAFRTIGGGGSYLLGAENVYGAMAEWPHRGVDRQVPIRVHGTWFPETGRVVWELEVDGAKVRRTESRSPVAAAAATWRFEIRSDFSPGDPSATEMRMTIDRIGVAGLEPAPARPSSDLAAARRALANGDHAQARALLTRHGGGDVALAAAMLALRASEPVAAIAALKRVRGGASLAYSAQRPLAHITRVDDGAHASVVRTAIGRDWVTVTASAWTLAALQHPDAETVQRELTQNLHGLELPRHGDVPLLLLRARAYAVIGELAMAEADLDALLAPTGLAAVAPEAQADAYLERARVALRRGADAAASRAILAALDVSPWPTAVADTVLLDPALSALAAAPGLERVHAIGRQLAWPP
jgi:hypothetical protein